MAKLLLVVIYLAFIGLGLPDSLLGVTWPMMRLDFKAPLEAAGLVSIIIMGGTILSSFVSGSVLKRLSVAKITLFSTAMTAAALTGFSITPSLGLLLVFAVPLGLGAGSIDAALNYYVAKHYRSHHMNWLHSFWGLGASLGPLILSRYIAEQNSWRGGCLAVSLIQFGIAAVLLASLPFWSAAERCSQQPAVEGAAPGAQKAVPPLRIKGVRFALMTFLFYCGAEYSVGLWGSSYLVNMRGLPASTAAWWISVYYLGITLGRFLVGFATFRFSNPVLIRTGILAAMCGVMLLLLPLPAAFWKIGFLLIGLGCAPVFPCMIHETPVRFGKENAASIIGYQMGFAYIGSTFLPPLLGILMARLSLTIFPFFILAFLVIVLLASERLKSYRVSFDF